MALIRSDQTKKSDYRLGKIIQYRDKSDLMLIRKMYQHLVAFLIVFMSITTTTQANENICHVIRDYIFGDPIVLNIRWPLNYKQPPELLKKPDDLTSLDNLFSDSDSASNNEGACEGGSIVQVLNCDVIDKIKNQPSNTNTTPASEQVTSTTENNGDEQPVKSNKGERDYTRYAYGKITLRPALKSGVPMKIFFATVDTDISSDPRLSSKDLYKDINQDLKRVSEYFQSSSLDLDDEALNSLSKGEKWPSLDLAMVPDALKFPKATVSMPDEVAFPKRCGELMRAENSAAKELHKTAPLREKLAGLKKRKHALDHAKPEKIEAEIAELKQKREAILKDGGSTRKIDSEIKAAENRLAEVQAYDPWYGDRSVYHGDSGKTKLERQIRNAEKLLERETQPATMQANRAERIRTELSDEAHEAKIAKIKSDPDHLLAERLGRTEKARSLYREIGEIERGRKEGIEAYRKGLADFDSQIAAAPDDETREALVEKRERYKRLYDSWSDQSTTKLSSRHKDLNREMKANAADGIGPSTIQGIHEMSEADGIDTKKYFSPDENENKVSRAAERAKSETKTLGGTAGGKDASWDQIAKDTATGFVEEVDRVQLSPAEIAGKLKNIAEGKTTFEDAFKDQIQFSERYGHYAKGAGKGAVKGLFDIGDLAYKGSSYTMEEYESLAENFWSGVTGTDVDIDIFGDRQHRALDKLGESALTASDAVLKRSNLQHGVRTDEQGGMSLEDVWSDPTRVGEYLGKKAVNWDEMVEFGKSNPGRIISGASDLITEGADGYINRVNKGGETALRDLNGNIGSGVTQALDLGVAGLSGIKRTADFIQDGSKVARSLEDGLDGIRATENAISGSTPNRVPESLAPNAPNNTPNVEIANLPEANRIPDQQPKTNNSTANLNDARNAPDRPIRKFDPTKVEPEKLNSPDIPDALRPTERMNNPPVVKDDFASDVPGDIQPSNPDLTNVPKSLRPTEKLGNNQNLAPSGEKTEILDLDVPPPNTNNSGLSDQLANTKSAADRPVRKFDPVKIEPEKLNSPDIPGALRPTERMNNPPVVKDDFASDVPGDIQPSNPDLTNVPKSLRPTEKLDPGQGPTIPNNETAKLNLELPGAAKSQPLPSSPEPAIVAPKSPTPPAKVRPPTPRAKPAPWPPEPVKPVVNSSATPDVAPSPRNQPPTSTAQPSAPVKVRQPDPRAKPAPWPPEPVKPVTVPKSNETAKLNLEMPGSVNKQPTPSASEALIVTPKSPTPPIKVRPPDPRAKPAPWPPEPVKPVVNSSATPDVSASARNQPPTSTAQPSAPVKVRQPDPRAKPAPWPPEPVKPVTVPKSNETAKLNLEMPSSNSTNVGTRPVAKDPPTAKLDDPATSPSDNFDPNGVTQELKRPTSTAKLEDTPTKPTDNFDPNGVTKELPKPKDTPNAIGSNNSSDQFPKDDVLFMNADEIDALEKAEELAALQRAKANIANGAEKSEVVLSPDNLADKIELDGRIKPKEMLDSEVGFDPKTPFKKDLGNIADEIPTLHPNSDGPGFTAKRLGDPKDGQVRDFAENSEIEIRTPNGETKNYRLGEKLAEGGSTTVYQSLDANGIPDGNIIRLTDIDSNRVSLFSDLTGRELLKTVENSSPYFSTSASSGRPDILRARNQDVAISREVQLEPASSQFKLRNDPNTHGLREPNKLESLTMQLAIRDLNKRGLAWVDHKMQNFALVKDANSPTGYRMVIFDTGSIVPMRGKTAGGRASNAAHVQRHYDRPSKEEEGVLMTLVNSNITGRADPTPFGKKLGELEGINEIARTSAGKNRGRDQYFEFSNMSDLELKNYIDSDVELRQLLEVQGKIPDNITVR